MTTDAWKASKHNEWMRMAYDAPKTKLEEYDWKIAKQYFQVELCNMADRTRSSIFVGVFGLLHQLNTGLVRELLSGETNWTPRVMLDEGISTLVNAPPAMYGDTGNVINAALKFATQFTVLRRDANPTEFFNVIFVDEAQQFVNTMDSHYLAQCRSHLGCMIFFSQSRHSYYAALGGETGKHKADALLANFNLKIFNALGDAETAEWASELVGRELKTFIGGSCPAEGMWDVLMGQSKATTSFSTHYEKILEPNVFMHGLRTGGAGKNQYLVDAVLVKTGEPFSDGRNWMQTSFSQR
jgi:TraM recognition site of TraD and TraG